MSFKLRCRKRGAGGFVLFIHLEAILSSQIAHKTTTIVCVNAKIDAHPARCAPSVAGIFLQVLPVPPTSDLPNA